ncbi:hypothetical protein C6503_20205 [Candidatus Poribacteria bacterium]|nr:MAG: hypothetical protein C6503_20205 [Candidatus Poribacteria bacterium]
MTGFWAVFVVGLLKAAMKFAMKFCIAASNTHSYQNIASDKKYAETPYQIPQAKILPPTRSTD